MKPTDITALVSLGAPALAPDRRTAVVTASSPDLEADATRSALWAVALDDTTPPRRLTHGDRDRAPAWSPDGEWLAFLRDDEKKKPQVWLLPAAGGDARRLTDVSTGAGAPRWSPDGTRIAFSARVPAPGRHGTDEDITREKEPPRRITGLQYRRDGVGFLVDHHEQVFVTDVETGATTQLTDAADDSSDVAWFPDSQRIAFVAQRRERDDTISNDAFAIAVTGGEEQRLTDGVLGIAQVQVTADGASLLLVGEDFGPDGRHWVANNTGLFLAPVDGSAAPRRLTDEETVNVAADVRLVVDGQQVLFAHETRGAVELASLPLHGAAEPTPVSTGRRVIGGVDARDGTVVVAYADPASAGELALVASPEPRTLTDFGARLRETSVRPLEDFTATAPDGAEVHGFLVVPDGPGPHPVLLMIHGGPFSSYKWSVFDEAQVYAGAGYAVVYTNPRGSSGYGQAYGRHIIGDVGERSAADLLALLDTALERPELDASRVGVLGGSHGGFMTSWLVGHTDRFAAAVSERAVNAIDSFTGSSDIGWGFADALYGEDLEQQRVQSPLTYAERISTPLLIVHSEQDWRCPVEQAQRLYVALQRRHATVEMLLFPGEGHELSRSGLPSHRVARFDAILDWFDRYLR